MAAVIDKNHLLSDLLVMFKDLATDDLDAVRVAALGSLCGVVKVLSKDINKTTMLSILIQSTEDKSWKIRHALALSFPGLITVLAKEIQDMNLIGIFSSLLRDHENEVKLQSLKSFLLFQHQLSNDKLLKLLPHVQVLLQDPLAEIRQLAADVTSRLFLQVGKDSQILKLQP